MILFTIGLFTICGFIGKPELDCIVYDIINGIVGFTGKGTAVLLLIDKERRFAVEMDCLLNRGNYC